MFVCMQSSILPFGTLCVCMYVCKCVCMYAIRNPSLWYALYVCVCVCMNECMYECM